MASVKVVRGQAYVECGNERCKGRSKRAWRKVVRTEDVDWGLDVWHAYCAGCGTLYVNGDLTKVEVEGAEKEETSAEAYGGYHTGFQAGYKQGRAEVVSHVKETLKEVK